MSNKAECFNLFNSGHKPSDPEVKALGLKPKTSYSYYQEWKKGPGKTHPSVVADAEEITELKQEKVKLTLINQITELKSERDKLPSRVSKLEKQIAAIIDHLKEEHIMAVSRLNYHAAALGLLRQTIDDDKLPGGFKQEWQEKLDKSEIESKQEAQQENKRLDAIKEGITW